MEKQKEIASISASIVDGARAILASMPTLEPIDADSLRAVAIASDTPKAAARQLAFHRYEQSTAAHRVRVERARQELARHRERLTEQYRRIYDALRETSRVEIDYSPRRRMTLKEKFDLALLVLLLAALLGASVATIKTVALDTGIVQSGAQALAFGLVPVVGAFVVAHFVGELSTRSAYLRAKRAVNVCAMMLLGLWTPLFVVVFGTGATADIDDIIAEMTSGGNAGSPSGGSLAERAFFVTAILFEVFGGATFKLSIEQILGRSERCVPERAGLYAERERELAHISTELGEVEAADTELVGRLDELRAGGPAYADAVLALLLCTTAPAAAHAHASPPPRPMVGRATVASNNGSI